MANKTSNIREFIVKSIIVRNANRDEYLKKCRMYEQFYKDMHCSVCDKGFCLVKNGVLHKFKRHEVCICCNKMVCHSYYKTCSNSVKVITTTYGLHICINCIPACQNCGLDENSEFYKKCPSCNRIVCKECWVHNSNDDFGQCCICYIGYKN